MSKTNRKLISELQSYPTSWTLTPTDGNKRPYRRGWQNEPPLNREEIALEITAGKAQGVGVRSGQASAGLLCIDFDGHSALDKWLELSGNTEPPLTVGWTSGKPGRWQLALLVPLEKWDEIATKKIPTAWDGSGKPTEYLEIRWDGCQSVLPGSVHPQTGSYNWLPGQSPAEVAIAPMPGWVLEIAKKPDPKTQRVTNAEFKYQPFQNATIDPGLNPWDIRNFAPYLEGYRPDGRRGWDTCKCPGHNGTSDNSLHIEQSSGAFKCHAGCNPKDVYHSALELAQSHGYTLPQKRSPRQFPDFFGWVQSERTISANEWELKFGLPDWVKEQVNQFKNLFKRNVEIKATAQPTPKPPKPSKFVQYQPGEQLPTPERYAQMGCPTIRFAPEQRLETERELVALGYQLLWDASATGTFKSHDAGLSTPEMFGVDRLWYLSTQDHRNPQTPTVEANYADMPVRNDGMVVDESRRTALNNPHQRWPREGETPTTAGNCFQTKTFHTLSEKGFQPEVEVSAKDNPICRTCSRSFECAGGKEEETPGAGYSFRSDRRKLFKNNACIRGSINSLPSPEALKKDAQVQDDETKELTNGAFVDEAMRELNPVSLVTAELADFDKLMAGLEEKLPIVHGQLRPFRLALRPVLGGEVRPTKETYHGWGDTAIRDAIGEAPENLEEILRQLELIKPKLEDIFTEPDSFNLDGVDPKDRKNFSRETSKYLRDSIRRDSHREMREKLRNLASNWLIPFLKVWGGLEQGALRIKHGVLTVTTRNLRHAEVIKAMKFAVLLDTTATREMLALYLNVDPAKIVRIEQEPPRYDNLTIVQVTGLGLVGHSRSDSMKARVEAAKQTLKQIHPSSIRNIEIKEYAAEGDGWWFYHNRASNEFKTLDALASFGIPYQDIGSLQATYIALTGDYNVDKDAPGFSAFVQWQTQSEIAQAVGRLRANLRPNEQLTYYFCADYDLEFLQEYYPGATLKKQSAFSLTPEAGNATERSHHSIKQKVVDFAHQTGTRLEKLTQAAAAKAAGVTQGRISQVAAEYGGWAAFKKLLVVLFNSLYRTANNFEPLNEEQRFIADAYLPLVAEEDPPDVIKAMVATAKAYGWQVFEAILAATSVETRGRLAAALLSGLPAELQNEFRALAVEA